MVTGRTKGLTLRGKGNVVLVAAQLDDADGNPTEEYVLLRADEFGRLRTVDAGGVSAFLGLTDTPVSYAASGLLNVRVNAAEDALEFADPIAQGAQFDHLGVAQWSQPGWNRHANSTGALFADARFYIPIFVERAKTFTQIGCHVTSAGVGGSVARLGVYAADRNGAAEITPGALELDAGTVAIDTTGEKLIAISLALATGYHFLCISVDAAATFVTGTTSDSLTGPFTTRNTVIASVFLSTLSASVADGAAALANPATVPIFSEGVGRASCYIGGV